MSRPFLSHRPTRKLGVVGDAALIHQCPPHRRPPSPLRAIAAARPRGWPDANSGRPRALGDTQTWVICADRPPWRHSFLPGRVGDRAVQGVLASRNVIGPGHSSCAHSRLYARSAGRRYGLRVGYGLNNLPRRPLGVCRAPGNADSAMCPLAGCWQAGRTIGQGLADCPADAEDDLVQEWPGYQSPLTCGPAGCRGGIVSGQDPLPSPRARTLRRR
jgi:hypothetical protein